MKPANRESFDGVAVEGFDEAIEQGAGAFYFVENDDGLYIGIMFPEEDGPRELPINQGAKVDRRWQWDGNREKPTLSPSIACLRGDAENSELWHGYMRAGKLESC